MKQLAIFLPIVFFFASYTYGAKQKSPPNNYEQEIFYNVKYTEFFCPPGLKFTENQIPNEIEIGCRDEQGKLQGIAIRLDSKRKKTKTQVYRDNQPTHDHTVAWDENGKINYTEEKNSSVFWYDFKKKKKRIETVTQGSRKETRTWYPNEKLESLTVEEEGLPTQVLGWDENGNRIGNR